MLQRQASPTISGGATAMRSPTWQAQHLTHPAANLADSEAKEKPPSSRLHRFWQKYDAGNWALLACLIVITICVDLIPPRHRFILNTSDPTISFPLVSQTVPMWLLILLVIVTPLCVIIAIFLLQRRQAHAKRELYFVAFGFCYGMVLTILATDCIKRMAGRPRPNFLALSGLQDDGSFTGSPHDVSNAYQSFPSGHTSSAFAGLGYLSLYLFRLCFPESFKSRELAQLYHINQGWKTIVCLLPMALATWIGLTRITDYWHGFDDVSIGAILGLSIAAVTFQLHVNWWWSSLHGLENDTTCRGGETSGIGGIGRMRANSREESHYGLLTTPTGDNLAASDAQV